MKTKQRRKSVRRDLLVLTWDEDGDLLHVSQCRSERGAAASQRYSQKTADMYGRFGQKRIVQIVDAAMLRLLGDATTRDTEIAELKRMAGIE